MPLPLPLPLRAFACLSVCRCSVQEALKEANATKPAAFATLFGGEPDARVQNICVEIKLLDAVFEAALAPYVTFCI